ncbi:MAG: DUF5715 family protein [Gemmatimonadota bacterium]
MRVLLLTLTLPLTACGWVETQREEAAAAARAEVTEELSRAMSTALRSAEASARRSERILRPLPVAPPGAEARLRVHRNAAHVARARALGVRVGSDSMRDSLYAEGRLIQLPDSTEHWIVRRGTQPAYAVPEMEGLLSELGRRFQARLDSLGVAPFRIEVTSALRTTEHQRRLARVNTNAATGVSSHEFGTTVDISYAAFNPPAAPPHALLAGLSAPFADHVHRFHDLAFESVSGRKSRELGAILTDVLNELQDEGLALVIHERQQTVYHVTVASSDFGGG